MSIDFIPHYIFNSLNSSYSTTKELWKTLNWVGTPTSPSRNSVHFLSSCLTDIYQLVCIFWFVGNSLKKWWFLEMSNSSFHYLCQMYQRNFKQLKYFLIDTMMLRGGWDYDLPSDVFNTAWTWRVTFALANQIEPRLKANSHQVAVTASSFLKTFKGS